MKNPYLESLLSRISEVPTLPTSVLRVMQMIEDPFCSSSDLARVIQADPAMAAKVLKLANSSYYGFRQKIANIPQAVTLLGFATLKNALLAAAVFDMFRLQGTGFDLPALWKHSVTTATAAKLVAKRARYPQSEKAFTAALLHDVGKIVLARFIPQALAEIMDAVRRGRLAMYDAEKKVIGPVPPGPGRVGAGALGPARPGRRGGRVPPPPDAGADIVRPGRHRVPGEHPGPPLRTSAAAATCLLREVDPVILEYFSLNEAALAELLDALVFKRLEIESYAAAAA